MSIPRPEYPRPQWMRRDWLNLNGIWQFEMDPGDSGRDRSLLTRELAGKITVPFCMESTLSGVGHVDFMPAVWYRREVSIPPEWAGRRVLLHIGAADHDTFVWVNGQEVGRHRGGWTPITCDLHGVAAPGERVVIVVRVRDNIRQTTQAGGKQSIAYGNERCMYTRTTGIWQTVWLEPVPNIHLRRPRITPDVANRCFHITQPLSGNQPGSSVVAIMKDEQGQPIGQTRCSAETDLSPQLTLSIPENRVRLWEPGQPYLYNLEIQLRDAHDNLIDQAQTYAGLRSVAIDGQSVKINGKVVFQRLVLDQGYYPDGILTAPSDEALCKDIELSMAVGFNGARLHQKVFEERFLYHADRMGYLVWGEFGDWSRDRTGFELPANFLTQWLEVLQRDYSHPCIVGWCGLNETVEPLSDRVTTLADVTLGMYLAAKAMDTSRPVLDVSGYSHRVPQTDVMDSHNYQQDVQAFAQAMAPLAEGQPYLNGNDREPR